MELATHKTLLRIVKNDVRRSRSISDLLSDISALFRQKILEMPIFVYVKLPTLLKYSTEVK
jgi:hypothetical protein